MRSKAAPTSVSQARCRDPTRQVSRDVSPLKSNQATRVVQKYRSTAAAVHHPLWSAALCVCRACANAKRQGIGSSAPLTNERSVGPCLFLGTLAGGHAFETDAGLCCVTQAPLCEHHSVQHLTDTSTRRQRLQGTTCVVPHADPYGHTCIHLTPIPHCSMPRTSIM